MIDRSDEGLIYNNNKKNKKLKDNVISFDSISEKQEESSDSSNRNSKLLKSRSELKSTIKHDTSLNDALKIINMPTPIKRILPVSKNSFNSKKRKSIKEIKKENDKDKRFFRKNSKKKNSVSKRISFQNENLHSIYKLKNFEQQRRSSKNIGQLENKLSNTILKTQKSLNITLNIDKEQRFYSYFNNKNNSILGQSKSRIKGTNISNSEYLGKKYFSNKRIKNTVLRKNKLNLKEQRNMNATTLFERLKGSSLFEKTEALSHKIKICYGFLAVFSFLSILLEIIDVMIFNKRTVEFLETNYNIYINNETNINNFYFIEKRKITKKENTIRIFNLIFSAICFFIHLIMHFIKKNFDKESKKKKKRNYYYNYNYRRRKTRLNVKDQRNANNENHIKLIVNKDLMNKNYVTRGEIIILVINSIISLVFYPPWVNKVFIGIFYNSIYVCSLNNIFLIFTFFKLANIYTAFYYLSPINNLLYKTICSSNMVKMDFIFMFRFLLKTYPAIFIISNFIIIGIVICILLYNTEYFSINMNNGIFNKKGENDLKNFYNEIYLFCFYTIKTLHGNIKPETGLGVFILIFGGTMGLIIVSYFIYFINQFIEFKPEEQQAYSKLMKLLNPINNEHKSSNVLQVFFLMKKMFVDFKNIEDEYRIKRENRIRNLINRNLGFRKSNFNFATNESNYSDQNLDLNYEYKEKKKFIKYITTRFILKIKLINETKNFKNNLLIARNYSLSFNDVLKTLVDKINGNITQLNNKLELLIKNDQKYRSFMKNQDSSAKKVKKIIGYQESLLNFLIERNNEITMEYYDENKQMRIDVNSKYLNKHAGLKRMRSSLNGQFLNFTKKSSRKKSIDEPPSKASIGKKNITDLSPKKVGFKRLKSSFFRNTTEISNIEITRAKTNPIKRIIKEKLSKSFDDKLLIVFQNRNKENEIDSENRERFRKTIRSLSGKKNEVISKWRKKVEK